MSKVARVIVDLSLDRTFDYEVPPQLQSTLQPGHQVTVPFGRRHARGFVIECADSSAWKDLKPIHEIVGNRPLISEPVMKLARWMSDYYAAPLEQAVRTVLPSAVRKKNARFKTGLFVTLIKKEWDAEFMVGLEKRAPKQAAVLKILVADGDMTLKAVTQKAKVTGAVVRGLEQKGVLTIAPEVSIRDPFEEEEVIPTSAMSLMPEQLSALEKICHTIDQDKPGVVLLHGVTGSGKTEVYMQSLQYVRTQNRGAIVLVPEISLTPQTVERFRSRFGDGIAVLHSHLSEGERHDEWHRIAQGEARIVIGARSALFAPVENLGMIVVDEEHETTYKQSEAPRYNARDVAVMRGHLEQCTVVLGSATPSLESFFNAKTGKYQLVTMQHRVDHRQMPVVRVVDMRVEAEKEGKVHVLSSDLKNAIELRLNRAEQTILFLNRRGFASSVICPKCGHVVRCDDCEVSMTYHKKANRVRCHMCGADRKVPSQCPNPECQDPTFRFAGIGTERIEEVLSKVFPRARVKRMDSDTMTRKEAYREALGDFRSGKTDVLVGTQMIAKGLDFPNVTLVGVVNADTTLHMPDFRAGERTFQLLTQVAGRAGRGDIAGEVIVQTFTPFHPAVQSARSMDYDRFYEDEITFRKELLYPPFSHLVCMTFRGESEPQVLEHAEKFYQQLSREFSEEVIHGPPLPAPLVRLRGQFRYQILIRVKDSRKTARVLKQKVFEYKWPKKVRVSIDVDALSLM